MNHMKTFILLAAMTALFGAIGYFVGGATGMLIALVVAAGLNIFAYWNSDKMVLAQFRAKDAAAFNDPRVRAYRDDVLALAQRAQMPPPKIYVIENPQPNAFATGRDPNNAAVAATTGLLAMLDRDEIRGVMAHELAHVKNRDTLTMTVTATLAGAIGMLANFALFFGGRDGEGRPNPIMGLAIMFLAPLAAALVQMAISRSREYEADRIGGEIGGDPLALASALRKIEGFARRQINPQAEANPATAHMFIINPLAGRGADNLFSTHPATQNRIAALEELARRMGAPQARRPEPAAEAAGPWSQPKQKGPWG